MLVVALDLLGLPDTAAVRSGLPLPRFREILASLFWRMPAR